MISTLLTINSRNRIFYWTALAVSVCVGLGILGKTSMADATVCPTPAGREILSGYGPRGSGWHYGIDIHVNNESVYAAEPGEVVSDWNSGYGLYKDLHASSGRVYRYAHLAEGGVNGAAGAGQTIGTSDTSGNATGPHLHWEIRVNGSPIDPTSEFQSCTAARGGGPSVSPGAPDAPGVTSVCNGSSPIVNISWSAANLNAQAYVVDLDDDNWAGGWWNKNVGSATNATGPSGFGFYPPPGGSLALSAGRTYYVRVFYGGPNVHSQTATFVAANCSTPTITQPTTSGSPPAPSISHCPSGNTGQSEVRVSWNPGQVGTSAYVVDLDDDNWAGGWWNKNVGSTTSTIGPGGFNFYPSSGGGLTFTAGRTYYVRVFYAGPNLHSQTAVFSAPSCATTTSTNSPTTTAPTMAPLTPSVTTTSGRLLRNAASNRCLDVAGAGRQAGTPTQLWDCHSGENQLWNIRSDRTIRIYNDSLCLGLAGSSSVNNTPVVVQACSGSTTQQWIRLADRTIRNFSGGKCLDANSASTGNGTSVAIWTCNAKSNQQWYY